MYSVIIGEYFLRTPYVRIETNKTDNSKEPLFKRFTVVFQGI